MSDITLESALNSFFEYRMRSVMTAIPAVIVGVDNLEEQRVDVTPVINAVFPDNSAEVGYPAIFSVPLIFPASSTSAFTFPINQGDTVLLVFSQKAMDVFKGGDGLPAAPNDYRVFDKRDAIAIPGLWPFQNAINRQDKRTLPHSTSDAVLTHNIGTASECEIRLKSGGSIEINGNQLNIDSSLNTSGAVTVGTGATGSFTTPLGQVVTVADGIITNIF